MLYLIGLGLNEKGYSKEAFKTVASAEKVYLESYTVEFPYDVKELEEQFNKKIIFADRGFVEGLKFLDEAKNSDVVLLVYGSPLAATTHITILQEAKKRDIKIKVIHGASVFDAVAETGLQLYKFGKTASMPNFEADSYMEIVIDNLKIKAHTLILIDMGLKFEGAIKKLERDSKGKVKLNKIIICERLGLNDSHIYYGTIDELLTKNIKIPFCIIIPSELHFMEREILEEFNN